MTDNSFLTDLPLAGDLVASDFETWPDWLKAEFAEHANDGEVGSRLLSEDPAGPGLGDPARPRRALARPPPRAGLLLDRDQRRNQPPAHP